MRLALLAHAPVPGGTTDILLQTQSFFRGQGHEVQSIFGQISPQADPRTADAWCLPAVPGGWRERMRAYVALIEKFQPDVVYTIVGHDETDVLRFLRCTRVRLTATLEKQPFYDLRHAMRQAAPWIEAVTANTPDAVEEIEAVTACPGFLLPYLIPQLEDLPPVELPRKPDPTQPIEIAYVGRLEYLQKRTHWFPEIIRRCRELQLPLVWHFYGTGPEEGRLRRKLAEARNVVFHGWTDHATLYRELPRRDLLFYCSRWEGLPVSMLEGMRCNLAVLAPDLPAGIHWTLEQGGGWLYRATSPRAAAEAVRRAVGNREELWARRLAARAVADRIFSPARARECFLKFEQALAELPFNGRALNLATARPLPHIRWPAYFQQAAYGVARTLQSPGRIAQKYLRVPSAGATF